MNLILQKYDLFAIHTYLFVYVQMIKRQDKRVC